MQTELLWSFCLEIEMKVVPAGLAADKDHPQYLLEGSPCATCKRKGMMGCSAQKLRKEISRDNMALIRNYFKLRNASV